MSERVKRSKIKVLESGVLRACLDLLAAEKIWHERRNTGGMKGEYKGKKRFVKFSEPGTGDIMSTPNISPIMKGDECFPDMPVHFMTAAIRWIKTIIPPRVPCVLWIETKSDIGKQTPEQIDFQKMVEAAGHYYLLVRDVDTLRDWLKEHQAL